MIYFKQNNNLIEKYYVTFDKVQLEELKNRIIYNCSFIEHKENTSEWGAGYKDFNLVRNLKSKKVGEHEYWEETRSIYKYTYDEYIPPRLVRLIDILLSGHSSSLTEIFNYDFSNDVSIDERIKKETEKFSLIDINDVYTKQEQLKKIDNLLKSKELNKDQENIKPYYDELISLIDLRLIDTISINEINRFESFFEEEVFDKENVRIRK